MEQEGNVSKEQSNEALGDENGLVKVSEGSPPPSDPVRSPKEPEGTSSLPGDRDEPAQPMLQPQQELRTSDAYQIRNAIPERFDHPGVIQ